MMLATNPSSSLATANHSIAAVSTVGRPVRNTVVMAVTISTPSIFDDHMW